MFGCKTDCARTIIEQKIGAKNLEVKYYMMMMEGVEFDAYFHFENQLWVILFFAKRFYSLRRQPKQNLEGTLVSKKILP